MPLMDQVGTLATAIAVGIAAYQVHLSTMQARTNFEDDLTREYREIARSIPVDLHLGSEVVDEGRWDEVIARIFQYLDLSNEQVFLRQSGRISEATWEQWRDGIRSTLAQPAFGRAWAEVNERAPQRFSELQRLEENGFMGDPKAWRL